MRTFKLLLAFTLLCIGLVFADAEKVTVNTTSTSIVEASGQRTSLLIKNTGDTPCFLTDESTATTDDFELAPDDTYIANERHAKKAIQGIVHTTATTVTIWTGKS